MRTRCRSARVKLHQKLVWELLYLVHISQDDPARGAVSRVHNCPLITGPVMPGKAPNGDTRIIRSALVPPESPLGHP